MWKNVDNMGLSDQQAGLMKSLFQNRKIIFTQKEDKIIWCGAKSGNYSVQIGYQILDRVEGDENWPAKLCWGRDCLPKAGFFA